MATFRVGQRVRIKWSKNFPELAGQEGTVTGGLDLRKGHRDRILDLPGHICYQVRPDTWNSDNCPYNFRARFAPSSDQLEPLYDGNVATTWDKCVWHPVHGYINEDEVTFEPQL
jgi:hypothetical protein